MKALVSLLLFVSLCVSAQAQLTAVDSVAVYHESTALNSGKIQQEKIYLHLDNSSYYRNDRIFFACYLVTSGKHQPSNLSQTVYVELLNPSGKVIDLCVLKAVDGRCHGSLLVNETPFYSGYYEVRAYTRYMLNFGPEAVFSRVIPVYLEPQKEGDWAERSMLKYGSGNKPFDRPKPEKTDKLNARFYPEGGKLVSGLESNVAFELTDENRRPLMGRGRVVAPHGETVATFMSDSMGRGAFRLVPEWGQYRAEISDSTQTYSFDLPKAFKSGIVLAVDNLTDPDSVEITVRRTPDFPTTVVGASLTCRGELCGRAILDLSEELTMSFKTSRSQFPSGIIQLTLFDSSGSPVADRLFFNNRNEFIDISYEFDKDRYGPLDPVSLELKMTDRKTGRSRSVPFSLSVSDAEERIAYGSNMMADLLLSSELKGYIHNPAYYFEDPSDSERREALDRLLMVQGWRRYSWSKLAGTEPIRLDSMPEKGIEVHGRVIGSRTGNPKPGVTVCAILQDSRTRRAAFKGAGVKPIQWASYETDSLGRFVFVADMYGDWVMTLSNAEKGKAARHRILLNRSAMRPEMRGYDVGEMNAELADTVRKDFVVFTDTINPEKQLLKALAARGVRQLKEVKVTAEPGSRDWEIGQQKENSVVSYDIEAARDILIDQGALHIRTLTDILPLINNNFSYFGTQLKYRGRDPLFAISTDFGNNQYALESIEACPSPRGISVDMIKTVYINEDPDVITPHARMYMEDNGFDTRYSIEGKFGCVVFIELHKSMRHSLKPGMRQMSFQGYTMVEEFYSPNYDYMPPYGNDYRRTLYWNPEVRPDENGTAKVRFFNNFTPRRFHVSTATLAPDGTLGGN